MTHRTNHIAQLTINEDITSSLCVRLYTAENRGITKEELLARALIAYAEFRQSPIVCLDKVTTMTPNEYLKRAMTDPSFEYYMALVKVNESTTVEIGYINEVVDNVLWRTMRKHMITEGTIEVRV